MYSRSAGCTAALYAAISLWLISTLHAQTSLPISGASLPANSLEETLEKRMSIAVNEEMTIEQLADDLREQFKINVVIDHRALDEVGLRGKTPIDAKLQLEGVAFEDALLMILEELELTFLLRDVVVVITTPERAEEHLDIHVYPVADLVSWDQTSASAEYYADYDTLIATITSSVAPDMWDEVGGAGSIESYPASQSLVIAQSRQVHAQIRALIETLRKAKRMQPALPVHTLPDGQVGSVPYAPGGTSAGRGRLRRTYRQGGFF